MNIAICAKCEYDKCVPLDYKSKRGYHHIYKEKWKKFILLQKYDIGISDFCYTEFFQLFGWISYYYRKFAITII